MKKEIKKAKAKDKDKDTCMASSATWSSADEKVLVQIMKQAKADGDWGDNNPKKNVWTDCEKALAGSEKISGGAPKNQGAIKNRWQCLKKEYGIVKHMRSNSGWGWNHTTLLPNISLDDWKVYISSHPNAKPYRTKPFPLYDDMAMLVGRSCATGSEAFRVAGESPVQVDAQLHGPSENTQAATLTQATTLSPVVSQMDAHTAAPTFVLDPALENEPPLGGISIPDDLDEAGGYFPPLFPPVTPVASSGKGKEVAATQNEAEIVNFNPTADPDAKTSEKMEEEEEEGTQHQVVRRRRSRSSPSTGYDRRKIRHVSAGQGMQGLGLSIEKATDRMRGTMVEVANKVKPAGLQTASIEPDISAFDPNSAAISAIEDAEGLSDCEFIDVCDAIMANPKIGSTYLAISKASSRTYFIQRRIKEHRKKISMDNEEL